MEVSSVERDVDNRPSLCSQKGGYRMLLGCLLVCRQFINNRRVRVKRNFVSFQMNLTTGLTNLSFGFICPLDRVKGQINPKLRLQKKVLFEGRKAGQTTSSCQYQSDDPVENGKKIEVKFSTGKTDPEGQSDPPYGSTG